MKRRRRLSAKQKKYFAPKVKRTKRKRVGTMAKGKYRGYARKGLGGMKSMIAPVLGGVADSYLDPMLPIDGVGATAIGMFMHNETLKNIGLYKVGFSIGNIIPLPGRGSTVSNGGFL